MKEQHTPTIDPWSSSSGSRKKYLVCGMPLFAKMREARKRPREDGGAAHTSNGSVEQQPEKQKKHSILLEKMREIRKRPREEQCKQQPVQQNESKEQHEQQVVQQNESEEQSKQQPVKHDENDEQSKQQSAQQSLSDENSLDESSSLSDGGWPPQNPCKDEIRELHEEFPESVIRE